MESVQDKFLRYVSFDTQSDPDSPSYPSADKEKLLAAALSAELVQLGAADAHMDEWGCVYAHLPANLDGDIPAVGFIAHMDTSDSAPGAGIHPRIVPGYAGGDILLNKEKNIVLSPRVFPVLDHYVGEDLIVTDGTTLLGADDKAGIAEIMTMVQTLLENPEIGHGKICIAFTPDEEVGRGVEHFDLEAFGADFAYTVDGGVLGQINYENFNAASANVAIHGLSVHPGSAKNKMINACQLLTELHAMLPANQRPEHTEGYEGFYHLENFSGTCELAQAHYIIRDHDSGKFAARKAEFEAIAALMNARYGAGTVELTIKDSYYNMAQGVLKAPQTLGLARACMEKLGIEPRTSPIRGGTDGAGLTLRGLPCPNLCTGGENAHGRFEFAGIQSMEKIAQLLVEMAKEAAHV
ncbi:MAG: peptidase T [Eubacteriales bacterium]|nr:peptidase T [Eubacteriales bacterium]